MYLQTKNIIHEKNIRKKYYTRKNIQEKLLYINNI
jgi:hypothetical protein